ncbi:MAG: hypothetical protein KZQ66_20505 [Candidatus Thiodiazotropha sp. (ex Lucinoma aequizonata)]|nr:hypothetical protein [Candidatus Thiodiazotropha sp. (ex Lucinoma aequizonata)]MCU7887749.1 hypothetical protein [Candidatus Thiodiazotropha sp. (ex Lucinoma aequizonata)]MCU7896824.1 hypothetical protein [Candidatus Thiodiazotropha sp. (ex Lucinoma aequizonata)]MCU7897990.1 hypothetical protein [Candidatus Thiodiazotropha sp. (ex Lucinoma aequizonata)]MCU7904062.1 hypothetical protein [Candidatus Thiodiazotropha sp. (ex Lucinoma aequizonata)]
MTITRRTSIKGRGEGAISAFIDAIFRVGELQINVINYVEHAIGEGADAEAFAYVQLNVGRHHVAGAGIDRDTVNASLKAVPSALN